MKKFREWDPGISDTDAEEMFTMHSESVNAKDARKVMDQTTLVRGALKMTPDIADHLAVRYWILGVAPEGTNFITSDGPVYLQWAALRKSIPPLWSPGFRDIDTTVMVPLGTRLMLIGLSYEHDRARVRFTRQQVAALNTDLALAAHRFVYSVGPTFAQVTEDGSIVEGPTDALRRTEVSAS